MSSEADAVVIVRLVADSGDVVLVGMSCGVGDLLESGIIMPAGSSSSPKVSGTVVRCRVVIGARCEFASRFVVCGFIIPDTAGVFLNQRRQVGCRSCERIDFL
jgi:hypothetical protein